MIHLILVLLCYVGIAMLIYSWGMKAQIPLRHAILYSVIWPLLFIHILWDTLSMKLRRID